MIMGSLSKPASDSHTKYHRPPERSSDLLGDACTAFPLEPSCDHYKTEFESSGFPDEGRGA
jgi:hypothetical protein